MQVEPATVTVYFHCRFLELRTTLVASYLGIQRAVTDAIRDLCKKVNQSLLLQSLYDTRSCDPLLEPEDSFNDWHIDGGPPNIIRSASFSRLKSMEGKFWIQVPQMLPQLFIAFLLFTTENLVQPKMS